MFTLFIAIGGPLDLGICYFKALAIVFALLTLSSLAGIVFFLYNTGFMP